MSHEGGSKAIVAALIANLSIAVMKFLAYFLTLSSSMLAEGIHSVADSGNQLLLLIGGKKSKRQASAEHPFGYGRERYIYAFIVSIVLFSVGGLFALYEAFQKWQHPHGMEPQWAWVPVVVLLGAIALEGRSFYVAVKESNVTRGKRSWAQFIKTAKAPELPVVLLEDSAALVGLVFALFGVSMTIATGNGLWDAAGTALIGVLLVCVAVILALETKSLLLGESANAGDIQAVEAALVGEGVSRIIHLKTLHLGPEELLVAAKIAVDACETGLQIAEAINAAEKRVRAAVPIAKVIYLEPDIYTATHEPEALP
ncbi:MULTISPECIES: cation diffusion facilitator family transporter [Arthrobacter]|uniref:cation diffusion facilitator family transporter n=1 Tax=unclassified Arthrobacter TaxID=235627 RepID=UPI0024BAE2D3|nr:cation diffusion facilitator family transporter [Arthrobacter sp. H35-MC1]MDJ0317699.1 cation diffusion facilitator family transporter [Arthrobacter sp. H35-MC1]